MKKIIIEGNNNLEGTIRITLGDENTKEDIDYFIENLRMIVHELRADN